ncbi:hypothetical protein GCM10010381_62290 [Streptomyces xantholiticus]|nr:hypothetical protein GCM10010381_62290 [Streptomyces xantholiticus]
MGTRFAGHSVIRRDDEGSTHDQPVGSMACEDWEGVVRPEAAPTDWPGTVTLPASPKAHVVMFPFQGRDLVPQPMVVRQSIRPGARSRLRVSGGARAPAGLSLR